MLTKQGIKSKILISSFLRQPISNLNQKITIERTDSNQIKLIKVYEYRYGEVIQS
jgi:hypothetical protein